MSKSTDTLVAELSSASEASREAAIARLAVIGARVVDRLVQLASSSSSPAAGRAAALQTLERIGDRRALAPALTLIDDPESDVAVAAIAVARAFVKGRHGVAAVDRLTAAAVDRTRPPAVRAAAIDALKELPASTIAPLMKQLGDDPAVRFPEPAAMRAAVAAAAKAPLAALLKMVEEVRQREQAAPKDERAEWTAVRGAAHRLLAERGSTIALYDLRESIERATAPLPPDFVAALARVGDAASLESIGAAYAKAKDVWWKKSLADAFRAIAKRERITRRHEAIKRIAKRWPEAAHGLGIRD